MGLIVKCECNGRNYCEETEERGNTLGVELIEINSCWLGDGDHCVVLMKRSKGEIL